MRIVHYISDFTSAAGGMASAVRMMMFSTAKVAENHLLTVVPLSDDYAGALAEQFGIKVHYLHLKNGGNPLNALSAFVDINAKLKELRPDIMYAHGTWDWRAAAVERTARRQRIVTLVSPHRGLSQELIGIDFWKKKLPRLIAFQVWTVRNCTAVIAMNDKERDDIMQLGLRKRIEVLPPVPKENESMEAMRTALMTVYRKALDSTYTAGLTQKERDVVRMAVRSFIADDDMTAEKPDTGGVSYRRIFFHAYDEDVTEMFVEGCKKMNLPVPPPLNVAEVPRYKNPKAKTLGALRDAPVKTKTPGLPADKTAERDAVMLISKAKAVTLPRLTLRHYAELYDIFRHSDFDEDMVAAELKRMHLLGFTRKLQKHLAEMFGLKRGYDIL